MQKFLILFCIFLATSVSASELKFKQNVVFESSVNVVSFKSKVTDTSKGGVVQNLARQAKGRSSLPVRRKLSFMMEVVGTATEPMALKVCIRFLDKDGFELFETQHSEDKIANKEERSFQWELWKDDSLVKRIYRVEIYCGDYVGLLLEKIQKSKGEKGTTNDIQQAFEEFWDEDRNGFSPTKYLMGETAKELLGKSATIQKLTLFRRKDGMTICMSEVSFRKDGYLHVWVLNESKNKDYGEAFLRMKYGKMLRYTMTLQGRLAFKEFNSSLEAELDAIAKKSGLLQ